MKRKSIEATAKYFIWGIFGIFIFVLFKVLQMKYFAVASMDFRFMVQGSYNS